MGDKIVPSIDIADIDMTKCWFNPGCAMSIYKSYLIKPMLSLLQKNFGEIKYHDVCCHHNPGLPVGATIINNCAGCDRRFRSEYRGLHGEIDFIVQSVHSSTRYLVETDLSYFISYTLLSLSFLASPEMIFTRFSFPFKSK